MNFKRSPKRVYRSQLMGWKNVAIGGKKRNDRGTYSRVFINATIGPNIWFFCSRIFNKKKFPIFFFLNTFLPKMRPVIPANTQQMQPIGTNKTNCQCSTVPNQLPAKKTSSLPK